MLLLNLPESFPFLFSESSGGVKAVWFGVCSDSVFLSLDEFFVEIEDESAVGGVWDFVISVNCNAADEFKVIV